MKATVEELLGQIEHLHLLSREDFAAMRARWFRPGRKDVQDAARLSEWLRVNGFVTEFTLSALSNDTAGRLTLNQYRLSDQLRSGAAAGDFLATDPLNRVLRVQIVAPALARDPAWFAKFRQTAQRLMAVQHSGVAHVVDVGQAHGVDYLVSEYVDGESLEDVLKRRGKLPHALAARVFTVVLEALHALHEHRVPGGDLSADCLIWASVEKSGSAARTIRLVNAGFHRRCFDSSALGIGAPGQAGGPRAAGAAGDPLPHDGLARPEEDIFRLGALFYRCLTGQMPFAGDGSARPGRTRAPTRHAAPEVPELLADLVDRMTEPDPGNRPQSAAAAAKSLRVYIKTEEEDKQAAEEKIAVPLQGPAPPLRAVREAGGEGGQSTAAPAGDGEDWAAGKALRPPPAVPGEPEINRFFRAVIEADASDLHLAVGSPPMMRLRNVIRRMDLPSLTHNEMDQLLQPILAERSRALLEEKGGADFAHVVGKGEGRFRVNVFKQRGQLDLVARRVNAKVPTFEKLGLPPVIQNLCHFDQGMVVIAGVTGSGKSTTLAAMLDYINEREPVHILTIEDPIEYLFTPKQAVIRQREVGIDVSDWQAALKHAVRQDPDVILIGEMRDRDTFDAGLHAAETGHLVFGTIHASSAPSTIGRILDLFPADMHPAIRQSLAFNLKAIVCQKLLPGLKPEVQRVPANEIMIVNPTIRELIVKAEDKKLPDAIRIGMIEGMLDFNESLRQLVTRGEVDQAAALEVSPNPDSLKMALKGIKVAQPGIL
jgi:twitching motility protein PilT